MKRFYDIEWYSNIRYDNVEPIHRHCKVTISKPTGKVEIDTKTAINIFTKTNGNLKKNTIVRIKEFDENGEQIGEDITPSAENAIIPIAK